MMLQIKSVKLWDWLAYSEGERWKNPLDKNINIIEERSDDVTKTKLILWNFGIG